MGEVHSEAFSMDFIYLLFYCPIGISPMINLDRFPWESQLQQCHSTQPTVHAEFFSACIISMTLMWTIGSLKHICDLFSCMYTWEEPLVIVSSRGLLLDVGSAQNFDSWTIHSQ